MQQAYYPPPMYPQPYAPIPQAPSSTGEAMKFMSWYIAMSQVLSFVGFIYILATLASPITMLGASCLVLAFAGIGFVIFILAAWKLWEGKQEFGPDHYYNVNRCVLIFVVQFIIVLISMAVIGGITSAFLFRAGESSRYFLGAMMVASAAFGIVNAYLGGLFIFYPGKYFMKPDEKAKATTARVLLVVGAIVALIVAIIIAGSPWVSRSAIRSVVGYSGAIFSIIAYYYFYQIYKAISDRFFRGEIQRPPPPMMAHPPYMMQNQPYGTPPPPPGYAPPPYNPYPPPPPQQQYQYPPQQQPPQYPPR
jgi:hypothetical protein